MSSNLPISSPYRSTPDAPVTDAERDRLNARLNAAYTAGALEEEDYQARLDLLFAARRLGELVPVVEGLPPLPTHSSPAIVANSGGEPGELSEPRPPGRLTAAVVGGVAAAVILIAISAGAPVLAAWRDRSLTSRLHRLTSRPPEVDQTHGLSAPNIVRGLAYNGLVWLT